MAKKPKQPKQPKPKKVKEKPEKEPKMRSSAPRRFGAWVLVIFMISMIGFGVYKIINTPTEQGVERIIEKQMSNLDQDTLARTKAVGFAERFATDYFTNLESGTYTSKMARYCADGVTLAAPDKKSQVLYVGTAKVDVDGDNVNVDVICRVAYAVNGDSFDMVQICTLRVPIKIDKNGNCSVVAVPIYVGNNNNPKATKTVMNSVTGENSKQIDAIKTTIKNFFEVYYNGTPSELKYYVTKNYGDVATTGLKIKVTSIDMQVRANGDKWDAECLITINNNGVDQTQHCFLEVVNGAEGRYYINKLYTIN